MTENESAPEVTTRKKRMYQPIWEAVMDRIASGNFSPVRVRIEGLSEEIFVRIRKAYWKERDMDTENRGNWTARVDRDKIDRNVILFSAMAKDWKGRI